MTKDNPAEPCNRDDQEFIRLDIGDV